MRDVFDANEVREVLHRTFYRSGSAAGTSAARGKKPKPDHYEVICISMYKEDLSRLDAKVAELKATGHRKINRSALIRFALDNMDLSQLPRTY